MAVVKGDMQSIATAGWFITTDVVPTIPDAPTLAVTNDGDGDAVTATVTGSGTITLYYRKHSTGVWTTGNSRNGDGTIAQAGLDDETIYDFIAVAESDDYNSVPSSVVTLRVSSSAAPIIEQIAVDLQTAVNAITVGNGWAQTLVAVRPTRLGWEDNALPEDLKVLVWQSDMEDDEELSGEGNQAMTAWRQPFFLEAFVISSDSTLTAIDTRMNKVRADIEKKIMEDPQRNALALDTRVMGSVRFSDGAGVTGIDIVVEVLFRTREDDPYIAA